MGRHKSYEDMTLREFEAVAERMAKASAVMQEALAVVRPSMGQAPVMQTAFVAASAPSPLLKQGAPSHAGVPERLPEVVTDSPSAHQEQVRRARVDFLREQRQSPMRQEKLAQFRHDAPEDAEP